MIAVCGLRVRGWSNRCAMSTTEHQLNKLGPAAYLTETEVRTLLATFGKRAPSAIRNRALVLLLWRSGLRISEALALQRRDLSTPTIRVREGKGGKERIVGLHQEAELALELWFKARRRLGLHWPQPVFCTISSHNRGQPISPNYVRNMLLNKGKRAGLERVHPHAFRASLAVDLTLEGTPLPAIRDVLGHNNIATTDAYLRRVFPELAINTLIDR